MLMVTATRGSQAEPIDIGTYEFQYVDVDCHERVTGSIVPIDNGMQELQYVDLDFHERTRGLQY